ncbi:MAG: radical SAM protein [Defluviitaleaceae bacterium]|nr:radical SAM protein [Defluviitaleaceae bacterium]
MATTTLNTNEVDVLMQMTEKKKISTYTIFIPKEDGTFIVANTLSGAIIHINDETYYDELAAVMSGDSLAFNENSEMHRHFYDSGVFVDDDIDEYQMALYHHDRGVVRDTALRLILLTTRQCNLRCSYCYEDFRNEYMSDETYESILAHIEISLKNKLYSSVTLSLFGGEPFLQFDKVLGFLKRAKAICDMYEIPFASNATTNFTLVTKERFAALAEVNCNYYQVTVDGFSETHDARRMCVDGSGSFNTIIKNLLDAKQCDYSYKIAIRTNFDEETAKSLEKFYDYIKENFDDPRFSIQPYNVAKMGGKNDENLDIHDSEQAFDVLSRASKVAHNLGIDNQLFMAYSMPYSGICYASKFNHYLVDCDGALLKCTLALDSDCNKVGQLSSDGSLEINHVKHCKWVNRENMIRPECKSCDIFPVCFGKGCPLHTIGGDTGGCDKENLRLHLISNIESLACLI